MSDFFSNLNTGARKPENTVFNQGPLPPTTGLPTGLNGTPDARINYNSTLLGDISAYSYGKPPPGRLSTQTAVLNVPHRVAKIVPTVILPLPENNGTFHLSHPIDDGDLVFAVRVHPNAKKDLVPGWDMFKSAGLSTNVDMLINLPTVNYLLYGLQRYYKDGKVAEGAWQELYYALGIDQFVRIDRQTKDNKPYKLGVKFLNFVAAEVFRPLGFAVGSDYQGGVHEGSSAPVTWPVNFVTSILVDGLTQEAANLWRDHNVSSGADLILRFYLDTPTEFVLNHWSKATVTQKFSANDKYPKTQFWVLKPDVLSQSGSSIVDCSYFDNNTIKDCDLAKGKTSEGDVDKILEDYEKNGNRGPLICEYYDYLEHGCWHVMRVQNCFTKMPNSTNCHTSNMIVHSGGFLLQGTVSPTFICDGYTHAIYKDSIKAGGNVTTFEQEADVVNDPVKKTVTKSKGLWGGSSVLASSGDEDVKLDAPVTKRPKQKATVLGKGSADAFVLGSDK